MKDEEPPEIQLTKEFRELNEAWTNFKLELGKAILNNPLPFLLWWLFGIVLLYLI